MQQFPDLGDETVGPGDEGQIEVLVHGMAGLELQGSLLDRGKQCRVIAVQILRDTETRHFPGGFMADNGFAAHRITQFGNGMGVHCTSPGWGQHLVNSRLIHPPL